MRGTKTSLADLKRVHDTLARDREQAERLAREEAARRARAAPAHDVDAFKKAMQAATPMKTANKVEHRRAPEPVIDHAVASRRASALREGGRKAACERCPRAILTLHGSEAPYVDEEVGGEPARCDRVYVRRPGAIDAAAGPVRQGLAAAR